MVIDRASATRTLGAEILIVHRTESAVPTPEGEQAGSVTDSNVTDAMATLHFDDRRGFGLLCSGICRLHASVPTVRFRAGGFEPRLTPMGRQSRPVTR